MKKFFLFALVATALFACKEKPEGGSGDLTDKPITGLTFTQTKMTIEQLEETSLPLEITPLDATNFEDVVFTYSYADVDGDEIPDTCAYVSADGNSLLADTLGRTGVATITATVGDITASMEVSVKTIFELVDINTWFGHWPQGGLSKNPEFDSLLTYAEVEANLEAPEAEYDSTKTWLQYCDSIGYSMFYILCNGTQFVNGTGLTGYKSAPVIQTYISYYYRRGTAANEDEQVFPILSGVRRGGEMNVSKGYKVDPEWTGEFEKNPNAKPGVMMKGYYDAEAWKGFMTGQLQDADGIFKGSQMMHMLAGGYWRPFNSCIVSDANVQYCLDADTEEYFLNECYIQLGKPQLYENESGDLVFEDLLLDYEIGTVGPINLGGDQSVAPRTRAYSADFQRHSSIVKSMNLAVMSKLNLPEDASSNMR